MRLKGHAKLIKPKEENIFQQSVSEPDIDWLCCVELNTSSEFRKWFAERLFPELDDFDHVQAWRSISDVNGESDLLWLIDAPGSGRIVGFIENKIKARAQPDQYLRYVTRGETLKEDGICQQFSIALLSPKKYRSTDSSAYPIQISYEDIVTWLREGTDDRSKYLATIYEAAINKLGTNAPVDKDITRFREQIWQLAKTGFPHLGVPQPGEVSATQYWVEMKHSGYKIIYKTYKKNGKFTNSVVDLELAGRGDDVEALQQQYHALLAGTGIIVVKTYESASFRLPVSTITPPIFDEAKVREALKAASKLMNWWENASLQKPLQTSVHY